MVTWSTHEAVSFHSRYYNECWRNYMNVSAVNTLCQLVIDDPHSHPNNERVKVMHCREQFHFTWSINVIFFFFLFWLLVYDHAGALPYRAFGSVNCSYSCWSLLLDHYVLLGCKQTPTDKRWKGYKHKRTCMYVGIRHQGGPEVTHQNLPCLYFFYLPSMLNEFFFYISVHVFCLTLCMSVHTHMMGIWCSFHLLD